MCGWGRTDWAQSQQDGATCIPLALGSLMHTLALGSLHLWFWMGLHFPSQDNFAMGVCVILGSQLLLEEQAASVAKRVFVQIYPECQLSLSPDLCPRAVPHAMVPSRRDYCSALYMGLPLKTFWKPQLVQMQLHHQ